MFDIAFSELAVIGIVGLIVIGPDKLPKVARTLGHLAGRVQRYASDIKSDINQELQLEELQKLQDEIRKNTLDPEAPAYQAGKIVRHDIKPALAEAGQQPPPSVIFKAAAEKAMQKQDAVS